MPALTYHKKGERQMCIIVYKPEGVKWKTSLKKQIAHCWDRNKDGCGLMVRHKGKVYMRKGLWTANEFYNIVKKVPKKAELALHFRWTSAGETIKTMCHPFALEKHNVMRMRGDVPAALMHNGTIRNLCYAGSASDTYHLADLLSKYHYTELGQRRLMDMVEAVVSGSRVLVFTKKDTLMWGDWVEHEGCFFSNSGYRKEYSSIKYSSSRSERGYYLEFEPKSNSYVKKYHGTY